MSVTQAGVISAPAPEFPNPVSRLIASAAVSSVGNGLSSVALGLLALDVGRDARWVSLVFLCSQLPWLLLGLPLARRVDGLRRPGRALIGADLGRLVVLLMASTFVATDRLSIGMLAAVAFALGIGELVHTAGTNALLPVMAEGHDLARANGYLGAASAAGHGSVGPALGGALYAAGRSLPFVGDAASFALSAALVRRTGTVVARRGDQPGQIASSRRVIAVVWRSPLLRLLALQIIVLGFTQAMVLSIAPVYGRDQLGLSARGYGVFLAVSAIGSVVGGLFGPRIWRPGRNTATLLLGGATFAGILYVLAGRTHQAPIAAGLFALFGVAVGIANTVAPTLRMQHAPPDTRGRVGTLFIQLIFITQPLGALLSGEVTHRYGTETSLALAGSIMIAAMLAMDRPLRRAIRAGESRGARDL